MILKISLFLQTCKTFIALVDGFIRTSYRTCKLCGEKQTLKQIFWIGSSGKEGREQVQQLNLARGQMAMHNAHLRLQQMHEAMMAQGQQAE